MKRPYAVIRSRESSAELLLGPLDRARAYSGPNADAIAQRFALENMPRIEGSYVGEVVWLEGPTA